MVETSVHGISMAVRSSTQTDKSLYRKSTSLFSRRGTRASRSLSPMTLETLPQIQCEAVDEAAEQSGSSSRHLSTVSTSSPMPSLLTPDTARSDRPDSPSTQARSSPNSPAQSRKVSSSRSPLRPTKSRSQPTKPSHARIGVWVDGATYWGETTNARLSMIVEETVPISSHPACQTFEHHQSCEVLNETDEISTAGLTSALVTPLDSALHSLGVTGSVSAISPMSLPALDMSELVQPETETASSESYSESDPEGSSLPLLNSSVTSDVEGDSPLDQDFPVPPSSRGNDSADGTIINKPLPPTPSYLRPVSTISKRRHLSQTNRPKEHIISQIRHPLVRSRYSVSIDRKQEARQEQERKLVSEAEQNHIAGAEHEQEQEHEQEHEQEQVYEQVYEASQPLLHNPPNSPTLSEAENELRRTLGDVKTPTMTEMSIIPEIPHIVPTEANLLLKGSSQDVNETDTTKEVVQLSATGMGVEKQPLRLTITRACSTRSILEPSSATSPAPRQKRRRDWKAAMAGDRIVHADTTLLRRHTTVNRACKAKPADSPSGNGPKQDSIHRSKSTGSSIHNTITFYNTLSSPTTPNELCPPLPDLRAVSPSISLSNPEVGQYLSRPEHTHALQVENVLISILASLSSLGDLRNMALLNKGLYRVYQENEMQLLSCVLFNACPPAAEFREWAPSCRMDHEDSTDAASSFVEQTPIEYMRSHRQDLETIEGLKGLICKRSASALRKETLGAISSPSHPHARRFDEAFWRIWCFCAIFGCNKDREDDLVGQLDWLRGGQMASSGDCAATVDLESDFEHNTVLLNPPDYFAKGNPDGLTSEQLFDMLELWTCLSALLDPYHVRVESARRHGVFDGHDVSLDDFQVATASLEEWTSYILTLGPATVFELATAAAQPSDAGFVVAKENGWASWTMPQYASSRHGFLKDSVTRLYREQLVAKQQIPIITAATMRASTVSQRTSHLALDIRLARQESARSTSGSLACLAPGSSRPSSGVGTGFSFMSNATNDFRFIQTSLQSSNGLLQPPTLATSTSSPLGAFDSTSSRTRPQLQRIDTTCGTGASVGGAAAAAVDLVKTGDRSSMINLSTRASFSGPSNSLAKAALGPPPMAIRPNSFFHHAAIQHLGTGEVYDTSTRAIRRLVDMGFLPAEARHALKVTDPGDGLRVDRAIEYLLQRRRNASPC